jgi:subtilisin family serine protease
VRRLLAVGAASVALLAVPTAAQAFTPNDPLAPKQWYLAQDRAFDAFNLLPLLPTVRVAVIDSGVDYSHPELQGRIVAARSFVGGPPTDEQGHGTFVAGEIAAAVDNARGIAGVAPSARLLIAKVVRDDGTVSPRVEAEAIRWAVDRGARVVNVSLGGIRDPADRRHSGFSRVEQRAVNYATSRGVLVVASVGNNPYPGVGAWPFASYPAALAHVVGVGSYGRTGDVSDFSNRDDVYVDLVAPGEDVFSLFPRPLTGKNPACQEQGYSSCGPKEYRHAAGTSFSTPQVSAAAAVLFALRPSLGPDQVSALLERTAGPTTPSSGCAECLPGRDSLSGWGRLDITAAVHALRNGHLAAEDSYEPDDDVRTGTPVRGRSATFQATIDYWDDPNDVYRVKLVRGQRISVTADSGLDADISLALWKPRLRSLARRRDSLRARRSVHPPGWTERIVYRARKTGWYSLQVAAVRAASGPYSVSIRRSKR